MANQFVGKASFDIPALKPYRGKPAVRNFRGGNGNVGIIRSPIRAITLPDNRHVGVSSEGWAYSVGGTAASGVWEPALVWHDRVRHTWLVEVQELFEKTGLPFILHCPVLRQAVRWH